MTDEYMTVGGFWWLMAAAFVALGVYAIVSTRREVRNARAARRAEMWARIAADPKPVRVHPHCGAFGHAYRPHQTVWMCGVCGDRIPRNTLLLEEEDIA